MSAKLYEYREGKRSIRLSMDDVGIGIDIGIDVFRHD